MLQSVYVAISNICGISTQAAAITACKRYRLQLSALIFFNFNILDHYSYSSYYAL